MLVPGETVVVVHAKACVLCTGPKYPFVHACTQSQQASKGEVVAVASSSNPSEEIMKILKKYNVTSVVKMASSYKFCVIANGEYDIYAAKERANEWDYAAGHAVAEHAGAIIKTLNGSTFDYGKENYANPSILMKRAQNLDD